MNKQNLRNGIIVVFFLLLVLVSYGYDISFGKQIGKNFFGYIIDILKFLPFVFILSGLLEAWIKNETIKKHLGENGGAKSFVWAVLLGGTTIGPVIAALPLASTLYDKGARYAVVFTFVGSAAVCRIPMTMFEASYLGIEFTLVRYIVSIPLIVLSSILLEKYFT